MKTEMQNNKCIVCLQKEEDKMKIIEYKVDNDNYTTEKLYECTFCGTHWKMLRQDSYHHAIVTWSKV